MKLLLNSPILSNLLRRQKHHALLFTILAALILTAAYRGVVSHRSAPNLQSASLQALQEITLKEPYNRQAFYQLGLRWKLLGDSVQANSALTRAATLDTDDEEAWLAWAELKSSFHEDDEAIHILSSYLKLHPDSAKAHLNLAIIHSQRQNYKDAIRESENAVHIQPGLIESWRILAASAESVSDLAKAENALHQVINYAPNEAEGFYNLGRFLTRHERYADSAVFFRSADSLLPHQPVILLALGQSLLKTAASSAEIETARSVLLMSAKIRPAHAPTCLAICESYTRQQRWKEALYALSPLDNSSIDGLQNRLQDSFLRSQIDARLGNSGAATQQRERHRKLLAILDENGRDTMNIARHPEDPAPRIQLARLCVKCGDYEEANAVYRKLLEYSPQNAAARQELSILEKEHPLSGRVFNQEQPIVSFSKIVVSPTVLIADGDRMLQQKNYPAAQSAYMKALALDSKSALACQGAGLALEAEGNIETAFSYLQQAVHLDPNLTSAQRTLAKLYMQAGFPNEAKRRLLQVVQHAPGEASGWHDLGLVYIADGADADRASEAFKRAVSIAPDNPTYLLELADALADHTKTSTEENTRRMQAAENAYRRSLLAAPENAPAMSRLGAFLIDNQPNSERLHEAEKLLKHADDLEPNNTYTLYNRGKLALINHQDQIAVSFLRAAVGRNPAMLSGWYSLAQAYKHTGQQSESTAALAQSRRLQESFANYQKTIDQVANSPKQANLRLQLARQYAVQGQNAHAINQYQVCLQLDPQNEAAKSEMQLLKTRLESESKMPNMSFYNAMVNSFTKKKKPEAAQHEASAYAR